MITDTKWNTPWQNYGYATVETAEKLFNNIAQEIVDGEKWGNNLSLMQLVLREYEYYCKHSSGGITYYDELFELLVSILGSESNKLGRTSPVRLEQLGGRELSIRLLGRCINACKGIKVNLRERDQIKQWAKHERPIVGYKGEEQQ